MSLAYLARSARRADVVRLRRALPRTYLLSDPVDIRHVLVTEEPRFPKNPRLLEPAEPLLFGEGLVGTAEAEHRAKRLALQPVFDGRRLAALGDVVAGTVDEELERWASQDDVALANSTIALALRIRLRVLLGAEGDGVADELGPALAARQRYIERAFVSRLPFAGHLPSGSRRGYRAAQRTLERVVLDAVDRRRRSPTGDLLTHVVGMRDEAGRPVGDRRAFDEARGFLASYELSARGLAWALWLVAGDAGLRRRLADEDDLLGYAQLVYSESLRLYPPTWLFVRIAPEAVTLPSGADVPAGARLFLSPWTAHRDPRWFPDPERFDPERFRPEVVRARPRSAYFPFGGGRHVCIGEGFVRMEAAIVLTRLARRFDLSRAGGTALPVPRATLEPRGGARIRLERRAA